MSELQSNPSELAPLGDAARDLLSGQVSTEVHRRGRERALNAFAKEMVAPRARRVRRAWISLAAAAMLAALLAFVLWPQRTLTFEVEGGSITRTDSGGAHIAPADEASLVRFSDGSTVRFSAGATGRIDDVGVHGARVVLASGSVHLDITHRPGTTWSLEAGPYVVHVTGTEFSVLWDPSVSRFEVVMLSGSVRVEAPNTPKGVNVDAGYVLSVRGDGPLTIQRNAVEHEQPSATAKAEPAPSTAVSELAAPAPSSAAPPEPIASATSEMVSARPSASPAAPQAAGPSWSELVSAGKYAEVVRAARARGIDAVAEHAALSDLAALSDAARYERDGEIARAVLEAQRKRFGDTPAGKAATFLLGRLAEDGEKNLGKAIALYDEYLSKGGPYAQEALGRKMVAVRKSRGDAAAKPIAKAYLDSYPKGAYASMAQSIVGSEGEVP